MSDTNALKKLCRTMITAFDRVDGTAPAGEQFEDAGYPAGGM